MKNLHIQLITLILFCGVSLQTLGDPTTSPVLTTPHCNVEFNISEKGKTQDIKILDCSNTLLNEQAVNIANEYTYQPATANGMPIKTEGVTVQIIFDNNKNEN